MEEQRNVRLSPHGKTFFSWEVDEYPRYRRSVYWYVAATLVGTAFLWYALATVNFLFALIVVIFGIILVLSAGRDPRRMEVALTEDGIELGTRFHPWRDFERFWIVYDPPLVKAIYLDFRSPLLPPFGLPLEEMDPNAVRGVLVRHVAEDLDRDDEPFADSLARLFKI